jgi:hypothetical protein
MTSNGRVARLTALALATGTLVAASASGATAATAATANKDIFTAGNAAGNGIIHLELNLPAAIPGLPGIGNKLVQDIVVTNSAVRTGLSPDAIATAVLGQNGNLPVLSGLLAGKSQATLAQPNGETKSGLPILGNALGVAGLLNLSSVVRNPNVDGTISHSLSSVANLKIDGAGVLDAVLQPILAQLNGVLGNLKLAPTTADGATAPLATVTDAVNTLLGTLDSVSNDASAPVTAPVRQAIAQVTTLLEGLLKNLNLNVSSLTSDTSLLSIGLIQSEQTVTRAAGTVTSAVSNKLVGIKVLGGLIGVDGLVSSATAALDKAGNPLATPTASGTLVQANLADILTAKVTNQIEAILGGTLGSALPADVLSQVNGLLAQITGLVQNVLGVQFKAPSAGTSVKQHNKASQEVTPAALIINPLKTATPLLKIEFVPAAAQVVRAEAAAPPAIVTPPNTVQSLPRTGAELPLTGAIATGLLGLALVARRRRLAHVAA